MIDHVRAALQPLLGDDNDWAQLQGAVTIESVTPGTCLRSAGDVVHELLVVARGVLEVETPGAPPRWAPPGAIIGGTELVAGAASPSNVTALRHARVARVSAKALWDPGTRALTARALTHLTRITQSCDDDLATIPPDPLVITIVLEGIDAAHERLIAAEVETAVATLDGARMVRIAAATATPATDCAGAWLAERTEHTHHHVRADSREDLARAHDHHEGDPDASPVPAADHRAHEWKGGG